MPRCYQFVFRIFFKVVREKKKSLNFIVGLAHNQVLSVYGFLQLLLIHYLAFSTLISRLYILAVVVHTPIAVT